MTFLSGLYTKADSDAIRNDRFLGCEEFTEDYRNTINNVVYESAVIALAVKLARVDGQVNAKELESFAAIFNIHDTETRSVRDYFIELNDEYLSVDYYAQRIKRFFPREEKTYSRLVARMFSFAVSDAPINAEEIVMLKKMADVFELSHEFFLQKLRLYMMPLSGNPYQILGVSPTATMDEISYAYHKAVKSCHPDRLSFLEPSGDIKVIANTRINTLATAFYVIKKHMRDAHEKECI